jgi:membrane protease subunit HflK
MYLDTMQQVYSNTSKVMIDAKGQGNLLYLPLDKLMQAAGAATAAPTSLDSPVQPTARANAQASSEAPPQMDTSLNNNTSRREPSLRSRERESR